MLSICVRTACRFEDLGPVLCAALDGLRLPSFPQVGSCSLHSSRLWVGKERRAVG